MYIVTVGMVSKKLLMGEGSQRDVRILLYLRTGIRIAQAPLRFFGHILLRIVRTDHLNHHFGNYLPIRMTIRGCMPPLPAKLFLYSFYGFGIGSGGVWECLQSEDGRDFVNFRDFAVLPIGDFPGFNDGPAGCQPRRD